MAFAWPCEGVIHMQILPIPCSFDNYSYLLICLTSKKAAVVDPTEAYPVMAAVEKSGVQLTTVFCTHHHHDHIGGIDDLQQHYTNLDVVCFRGEKERITMANGYVEDGDTVRFGDIQGRVLFTPGHTSGAICYHFQHHLFTGDTLFGAGCGRLFEGTPEQMYSSLMDKIAPLADDTNIYFGHEYTDKNLTFSQQVEPGNTHVHNRLEELKRNKGISTPSTLALEKKTNPFLRCSEDEVKAFAASSKGGEVADPVEVFAELRRQRNIF